MKDKEWCTTGCSLDEVIEMICFDDPSFKQSLEEGKKWVDSLTKEEKNELIDNVFRRIT